MILNRLYEYAQRGNLLSDAAFEAQPVPFVIELADDGRFLNVGERRGEIVTVKKTPKGGEKVERKPDKGVVLSAPRPHGNTASQGFARYFVDTFPRVLDVPVEDADRAKFARSRETFWAQVESAAHATEDDGLKAVAAFGRAVVADPELAARVLAAVAERKPAPGDRVTFAVQADKGPTILERQKVRDWYTGFFSRFNATKQEAGSVGFCTITKSVGPLPGSHPIKLSGIPGGLPVGVSLVSFDKPAFESYGLDSAANAAIGVAAADGYARGFQHLRASKDNHTVVGGTLFLFWTRDPADLGPVNALTAPKPEQIERLFDTIDEGKGGPDGIRNPNQFYLLSVSGNAARAVVRDYLERPLSEVRAAVAAWFRDLQIADFSLDGGGRPRNNFPLWLLCAVTAKASDQVGLETQCTLMRAAISGDPVPDSLLGDCIRRLEAEGWRGFRTPRMALMKLILTRRNVAMSEKLDPADDRLAYLCGQLLALFERIQYRALGEVTASVVDKFYGTFSADPLLVLDTLQRNARAHLRKMRTDLRKRGAGFNLDRELTELTNRVANALPRDGIRPQFGRHERAIFSFGYYHRKGEYLARSAQTNQDSDEVDSTDAVEVS